MPKLYHIHLSRHVKGCVCGPVASVDATGFLFDVDEETGKHVAPCREAIRACLPACYRKAFDRSNLAQFNRTKGFHFTLHSSRGKYLNTVYAIASP